MSGLDLLRARRADDRTRAIPVLVLSNSAREADIAEIRDLGVAGYLVKADVTLADLARRVENLLTANR